MPKRIGLLDTVLADGFIVNGSENTLSLILICYFFESFSLRAFDEAVRPIRFVQDNESKSSYRCV